MAPRWWWLVVEILRSTPNGVVAITTMASLNTSSCFEPLSDERGGASAYVIVLLQSARSPQNGLL